MTRVFGEVAALYDDIRPGYPPELATALLDYRGAPFRSVVDIGAGTGKGTAALLPLAAPITCIEPDPRMAAVLTAKFPQVTVLASTFEAWRPPAAGVDLVACATAWHWMDPATRNRRAYDALSPGGVLAVFSNRFEYVDPAVDQAIGEALQSVDPTIQDRGPHWSLTDVRASALFQDVTELEWHAYPVLTTQQYLNLTRTFAPFRRHTPEEQRDTLAALTSSLSRFDNAITMDIRTLLTLARR